MGAPIVITTNANEKDGIVISLLSIQKLKGLRESTSTGRTGGLVVEFSLGKETSLRAISLE